MVGDMVSGIGGSIATLFGSDDPPKAILNRFAAPTAKAGGRLSTDLLTDVNALSKDALDAYMAGQGKIGSLVGQQENVLNSILNRNLAMDPSQVLQNLGNTAFGFINPNVLTPLAAHDANADMLARRARGLNPASVDSSAGRLRNARIASGRYLDASRDAYNALPNLFGQALNANTQNLANAASITPQIGAAYEGLFARPTTGILNRINTAAAGQNAGGLGIQNILNATQGYQTPQNFADRLGAAGQQIGSAMSNTEGQIANVLGSVASGMGSSL